VTETVQTLFDVKEREEFVPSEYFSGVPEAFSQYLEEIIPPDEREEYERASGKVIVRVLADIDLPSKEGEDYENGLELVRALHKYYERVYKDEYRIIRAGFLGEYAAAYCFSEQLNCVVYYPTKEEDMRGKVDLWIDLDDQKLSKRLLALQVKVLPVMKPELVLVNGEEDVVKLTNGLFEYLKDAGKFEKNGVKMVQFCRQFGNVQPAYLVLPSPGTEDAVFNILTGEPRKEFAESLDSQIWNKIFEEEGQ